MAKKQPKKDEPGTDERYEVIVERLEDLVERIESGEIGLEESIEAYEQGVVLLEKARAILGRAEQRIESLGLDALRERGGEEAAG